jgi:hypothetical protein
MRENEIELGILVYLRSVGVFCFKVPTTGFYDTNRKAFRKQENPFVLNGVSDILGIRDGRFIAIEVKTKTGVVSEEQEAFIKKIKEMGGMAGVARNIDDVREILKT